MKSVRVVAPAKINWTLEVLGKRPDGYHEIRSVMQTVWPCDTIVLEESDDITLSLRGATRRLRAEPSSVRQSAREIETPEKNLAYRAAALLRERTGHRGGAAIKLDKHIPIAAGIGGGSSDAAAVLRGLRSLWRLDVSDDDLASIGADLGSDVPFFLTGGTACVAGRGERVRKLPDLPKHNIVIRPPRWVAPGDKTSRMYAAVTADHFTDGSRTQALAKRMTGETRLVDADIFNVFEEVLSDVDAKGAQILNGAGPAAGPPHLCGSGPSFFFLLPPHPDAIPRLVLSDDDRVRALGSLEISRTIPAQEALACYVSG